MLALRNSADGGLATTVVPFSSWLKDSVIYGTLESIEDTEVLHKEQPKLLCGVHQSSVLLAKTQATVRIPADESDSSICIYSVS